MEFGASFEDEVIYMGDVPDTSLGERVAFLERAREWKSKHGLVLGEGVVRVIESEGHFGYQMRAPRVSGPASIVERVSD